MMGQAGAGTKGSSWVSHMVGKERILCLLHLLPRMHISRKLDGKWKSWGLIQVLPHGNVSSPNGDLSTVLNAHPIFLKIH